MPEMTRPGLVTGIMLVACLAAQSGCAPTPVTRTVSTEQVTTTIPSPLPTMITTTTEAVAPPEYSGRRIAAAPRRSAHYDNSHFDDMDEEVTETIVPAPVPVPRTTVLTTTRSSTGN